MGKVARGVLVLLAMTASFSALAAEEPSATDPCEKVLQTSQDSAREAAEKLTAYVTKMKSALIERDSVIDLFVMGLLTEEHVLLLGPRGVAKTMAAELFFKNIIDSDTSKPSIWSIHMTPETTLNDTHGPYDWNKLQKEGVFRRILAEGVLGYRFAFVDEFFDGNPKLMRNMLRVMNERSHNEGGEVYQGKTEVMVLASNLYLSQVFQRAERLNNPDGPEAVIDRIAFIAFIPKDFSSLDADMRLLNLDKNIGPIPQLSTNDIKLLKGLMKQVQIPNTAKQFVSLLSNNMESVLESVQEKSKLDYQKKVKEGELSIAPPFRATKFHSKRTLGKIPKILSALVVMDWIQKKGDRELTVNLEDIKKLEAFLTLNGPEDGLAQEFMSRAVNLNERAQLLTVIKEREVFQTVYQQILDGVSQVSHRYSLGPLAPSFQVPKDEAARLEVARSLLTTYLETSSVLSQPVRPWENSPERIGLGVVQQFVEKRLSEMVGPHYKTWIQETIQKMELARQEAQRLAEEKRLREIEELRLKNEAEQKRIAEEENRVRLEIGEYRQKISELQARLEEFEGKRSPIATDLQKLEGRLKKLVNQRDLVIEDRDWHVQAVARLEKDLTRQQNLQQPEVDEIQRLNSEIESHQKELENLQSRLEYVNSQHDELALVVKDLRQQLDALSAVEDQVRQTISQTKKKIKQLSGADDPQSAILIDGEVTKVVMRRLKASEPLPASASVNALVDGLVEVLDPLSASTAARFEFDENGFRSQFLNNLEMHVLRTKVDLSKKPGVWIRRWNQHWIVVAGNEVFTYHSATRVVERVELVSTVGREGAYSISEAGVITAILPQTDGHLKHVTVDVMATGKMIRKSETKILVGRGHDALAAAFRKGLVDILPVNKGWIVKARKGVHHLGKRLNYMIEKDKSEITDMNSQRGEGWETIALDSHESEPVVLEVNQKLRKIALTVRQRTYMLEIPALAKHLPNQDTTGWVSFESRENGGAAKQFVHLSLTGVEWLTINLTDATLVSMMEVPVDAADVLGARFQRSSAYFVLNQSIAQMVE